MGAKIVTGMITLSLAVVEEMLSRVGAKLVAISLKTEEDIVKHAADAEAVIQALQGIWPRGSINPEVQNQPNSRIRREGGST